MNARLFFSRINPSRRRGGFTLIEVIVTLAIFILLTASVFGIMTAVVEGSNNLQDNQNRRDEISALRAYLKNDFANLAATDHLLSYRRGDGEGLHNTGLLLSTQGDLFAIDAYLQPNGLYGLRLGRPPVPTAQEEAPTVESFGQQLDRNQSALTWVALIHDVHSIKWRFQGTGSPEWVDDWIVDADKPTLVECSIHLAGDDRPVTMDFLVPHVVAPSVQNLTPAVANGH